MAGPVARYLVQKLRGTLNASDGIDEQHWIRALDKVDTRPDRDDGAPQQRHRLKVVCLITHFDPGGAQRAIAGLAEALRAKGHSVELWGLYRKSASDLVPQDARTILEQRGNPLLGAIRMAKRLAVDLRSVRPDAVIAFLPLACVIGLLVSALAGVKVRIASQRNPPWSYKPAMQVLDKLLGSLGIYTDNVANSHAVEGSFESYPGAYRRKMMVVYNGVATASVMMDKSTARKTFNLPLVGPLILSLGRLSAQKNYGFLLEVIAELPDVSLVLAGDGPLRDRLEHRCLQLGMSSRVHFLGTIEAKVVPCLLKAADLFALPSLYEGQSNALLEAMSAGLPILASDIPPQVETLRSKTPSPAGWTLPLEVKPWAAAIKQLVEDEGLRAGLIRSAQARAADFTFDRMAAGFEDIATARSLAQGSVRQGPGENRLNRRT